MSQPTSMDELNARQKANMRIEGRFADTQTVMPCPFCGAPDFMVYAVTAGLNEYADLAKPHECKECGRSARLLTTRDAHGVMQEIVQCGGPDQPEWMIHKLRRE